MDDMSYCNLDYIEDLEQERREYLKLYYTTNGYAYKFKLMEIDEYIRRYKRLGQ